MTSTSSVQTGQIRVATDADAVLWNSFLATCPGSNFYQRFEWESLNRQSLGHRTLFMLAEHEGRVRGVLPLVHLRSLLFGNVVTSMPFVNFGGPAALDEATERALVDAACRYAEERRCRYLEIRSTRAFDGLRQTTEKVSMTIELKADPEAMMAAFTAKHRKNLRRAQENGVEVRSGGAELLDDFFQTLALSWKDLGTPLYRKAYFADLLRLFKDDVRIFVGYHGSRPVVTALNGHFGDTVEGMWAGADRRFQALSPNYVLYWEMIADCCRRGFRYFHLGRSTKDSGAMQFKARWLAEPKQLYWNYHLVTDEELPRLNPTNPKFALAIKTWRRLPHAVLRVIGPPIARLIP